jgi:hypothetical protein
MQMGPSHDPVSWISGVWPLRILTSSCLGLRWFIVWAISTISEESVARQMASVVHHPHDLSELLEVLALRRPQWMLLEERNHRFDEVLAPLNHVMRQVLPMVVVAPVFVHLAHAEELTELLEADAATYALHHYELMDDLVAEPVAGSAPPAYLADEPDREASFSVYKPDDPATELDQPFLLIVRTVRIVTAENSHQQRIRRVPDGYSGFPAFGRLRTALLPTRGAAIVSLP